MNDAERFGVVIALVAAAALAAVLSNRLSQRIKVPAPALFLIGAAVVSDLFPRLGTVPVGTVQEIVTVALVVLLFDGGMHIGWRSLRQAVGAVVWLGVAGTLVTAAAVAALCHLLFGLDWRASLLIGTALAPTDPAVVFSVLGNREVIGRSGTLLQGESGANDPVGIALMVAILAAGGTGGWGAVGTGLVTFVLQMLVGAAVGLAGGAALVWFVRKVPLPAEGLYPLRSLAGAFLLYGVATLAHGSGFLAVFIAGILLGDVQAPFKADIRRFHSALASLAEIVAFVVLGLTVSLRDLPAGHAWAIGLVLAVLLAFLVRPLLVGLVLLPVRLRRGERGFVLWAGLKGAVPVLLATFILGAGLPDGTRLYGIVFVVVAFSVIVQGGLVPFVAARLGVPMRAVQPRPWAVGMRLRHPPESLQQHTVADGSSADGRAVGDLAANDNVWISVIQRQGQLVACRPDTVLQAGDQVLADQDATDGDRSPAALFAPPPPT
jgi:cell volume regulation protein A